MAVQLEICQGTTCFVMGSSELMAITDYMPDSWQDKIDMRGIPCLGRCKENRYGKAPFVRIDGEVMESSSVGKILLKLAEKLGDTGFKLPEDVK